MSDQIILLHDGQIEQQGDPFTIHSWAWRLRVRLSRQGEPPLWRRARRTGYGVRNAAKTSAFRSTTSADRGDTVKTAVRGDILGSFCTPENEGGNPFHLEKKYSRSFVELYPDAASETVDILRARHTHAETLSERGEWIPLRSATPENVVYYNNN